MMVQKSEGFARIEGFHPEGDFAKLHRHGIDIHPVDAISDYIAQGVLDEGGGRLVFTGADGSQAFGNAMSR